jgi:putative nucleotidyltransferase with HDIG domain
MARRNLRELGYDAGYPRSEFIRRIERDGEVVGLESRWKRRDGTTLYVRESARIVRDEEGNTLHYEGTIEDITGRKITEQALQESVETLRKAMEGTVQAMGMILESRDPYTAGHQKMVAELSCAIAEEMELEVERIDALRMAAAVHDLGKISVPAEILSKPGRLSEIESNMVRHHEGAGHDILRTINFPWPVAEIVSQYHERWDGSGYPSGLKGDEIMIEARILAVADVVEAMASHRPYRPALGIDKALDEVEKGKGSFFDPQVVDACIRLFREKDFSMDFQENGIRNGHNKQKATVSN